MTKLAFEEYNFEVINVENTGNNLLTVNKNSLTFDKSVADLLGFPTHIKPLLDRENKVFAIQACKATTAKSLPFSKSESLQKGSIKIQSAALRNTLRIFMDDTWKTKMRYQIKGRFIPEHKAFVFELDDFKELPPFKGNHQHK